MGGTVILPTGAQVAWTGGKPHSDWSGLDNQVEAASPQCVRYPFGTNEESIAYSRRTECKDKGYKKGTDFQAYTLKIGQHLRDNGMDTVLHVPSLTDPTKMIFLPEGFQQVTLAHVRDKVRDYKANNWDHYDRSNDAAVKTYLKQGLNADLQKQLSSRSKHDDTGAETFMRIVKLAQDQSVARFIRLRDQLISLSPRKEPGEDVSAYCDKVRPICNQLTDSGQWEWILLIPIVNALAEVSEPAFANFFLGLMVPLDKQVKEVFHLDYSITLPLMEAKNMTFEWILDEAEDIYRSRFDSNKWGPAKMPTGSKNSYQVNLGSMTEAELNSFVQSQVDKKVGEKMKHAKRDNNSNSDKSQASSSKGPKWREIAPKDGESLTTTKNGKTYKWCKKCRGGKGLWHNHTTEEHTSKKSTKTQGNSTTETTSANLGVDDDVGVSWTV